MRIPTHLVEEWPAWRLVMAKVATLEEIDRHWTLLDLDDANDALDLVEEASRPKKDPHR